MNATERFHYKLAICNLVAVPVGFAVWFLFICWMFGWPWAAR